MLEIFCESTTHYNLRTDNEFTQPSVRSDSQETESVQFKGPQLRQIVTTSNTEFRNLCQLTTDFQSVEFSERAEILLFAARGGSSIEMVPGYVPPAIVYFFGLLV